jgi:GTP-binding protein HflX
MKRSLTPTHLPQERAFLVGIELAEAPTLLSMDDSLRELALLAHTADLSVVGEASQKIRQPDPKTYLGSGKVEEIKALAEDVVADVILFDDELSPRHQRELERIFGDDVRIVDRTALILDIFALHARTREGALQVELAQYVYRLPRLTRAWTHLARQAGGGAGRSGAVGGVGLRGPGETQLEVDRREIGRRIAHLRRELEKVRSHRRRYRAQRKRAAIPTVAIVGYTNAGKSTLLNRLSGADVYVADHVFATLDPTTRRLELPGGRQMLLSDTVGFIQKLPTTLVAAFRATLEEIREADLLLHVVDITHPNCRAQAQAVQQTLEELEVGELPVVTALNKIDLLADPQAALEWVDEFERAVPVSAVTGAGLSSLLAALEQELLEGMAAIDVLIPYDQGRMISVFHEQGVVETIEHLRSAVHMRGRIPKARLSDFEAYRKRRGPRRKPADADEG